MYTLVRCLGKPAVTLREASTFAVAILLAELFYQFHSFSLECLAFLATWTVLSGLIEAGERRLLKRAARAQES
jgi:hypothetical protein